MLMIQMRGVIVSMITDQLIIEMSLSFKQMQSLLAGFTCALIYGSSYTYGTLVPFATSYIYYSNDPTITSNQMSSLVLVSIVVLNVAMPLSNIRLLQFSNRLTTLIAIIGICLSIFAVSFGKSFWAYLFFYAVIFGIFVGFGYLSPIKNCYDHIPHRKGLCSGVCILGYGISSFVFNFILLYLINPNNQSAKTLQDGRKMYSQQVANNVPFALRIMCAIYLSIGIIGILLMKPPPNKNDSTNQILTEQKEEQLQQTSEYKPLKHKKQGISFQYLIKMNICWAMVTLTCSIPFGIFIAFNYKQYGMLTIDDDSFLTIIGSCGAIFNGIGRLFCGLMFDKYSFRAISSTINAVLLITAILLPLIAGNKYLLLICISIVYFCYGGNYSLYPTHTVRILGQQLGSKVYFVVFFGFTLGSLIQWISRLVLVPEARDAKFQGFTICFYIFAGLNLVSLMLSIFIKYDNLQTIPK